MTKAQKENILSDVLCRVDNAKTCEYLKEQICSKYGKCRIREKTDKQLDYILSPYNKCTYLEACAGSGKTEVLGMKTAYEICRWENKSSGIAVLTFTNEAANTILERVRLFYPGNISTIHYIGTFASFVHGYIAQKFGYAYCDVNDKADMSFYVIEKNAKAYHNGWLNNYELDFPTPTRRGSIFANQIYFRLSVQKWCITTSDNNDVDIEEYYNQKEVQDIIKEIREKSKKSYLFEYSYFKNKIIECKEKFWRDGFATFEDMNIIALRCLKVESIAKCIAKKFPLIMVDECQDLSTLEIEILKLLKNAGANVHFIGDLNQAIYSFKDAYPDLLIKHINDGQFHTMHLKDNFRSCQKIVDVACSLQNIDKNIIGHCQELCHNNAAIYLEYENGTEALKIFESLLNQYGISLNKAIVLTRTSNLKDKLCVGDSIDYHKHAIINAIQLWGINLPNSKKDALILLGWQIQKWIGSTGRKDNYYCPDTYNVFRWRLTLRDILNKFATSNSINDFSGKKYGEWYRSVKSEVLYIVACNIKQALNPKTIDFSNISFRTPNATASLKIRVLTNLDDNKLCVDTIHSVKGCSYDAVLLVSSSDERGRTGYWEKWIDDKDETTRFGYVASTRPRYLLAWAVPKLSDEQRRKIESIGLKKLSD